MANGGERELEGDYKPLAEDNPPCLVILIHGTFASDAAWTRPDSRFRLCIAERFQQSGLPAPAFDQFNWSGKNTHVARRRASLALRRRIRASDRGGEVFLVAHSHGGNIALQAVRRQDQRGGPVAGVVTLATPFLIFSAAPPATVLIGAALRWAYRLSLIFAAYWLIMSVLGILGYLLLRPLLELRGQVMSWAGSGFAHACAALFGGESCGTAWSFWTAVISGALALVLLLLLLGGGWALAQGEDGPALDRLRERLKPYFYVQPEEEIAGLPILALSAAGDEALGILNGSWWAHRMMIWGARCIVAASLLLIFGGVALLIAAVIGMIQALRFSADHILLLSLLFAGTLSVGVPAIFLAGSWLGRLVTATSGIPAGGLGFRAGRRNLVWSIHARRRLEARQGYTHRHYPLPALVGRGLRGLLHSRLYSSPIAMNDIAEFILEQRRQRITSRGP